MKTIVSLETATQLAVFLENRPGTLARVCEALAKAGINIHALTVSDTVDHSVVRMIVSDPTKALMLLGERGVLAFENDEPDMTITHEKKIGPGTNAKRANQVQEEDRREKQNTVPALIATDFCI